MFFHSSIFKFLNARFLFIYLINLFSYLFMVNLHIEHTRLKPAKNIVNYDTERTGLNGISFISNSDSVMLKFC